MLVLTNLLCFSMTVFLLLILAVPSTDFSPSMVPLLTHIISIKLIRPKFATALSRSSVIRVIKIHKVNKGTGKKLSLLTFNSFHPLYKTDYSVQSKSSRDILSIERFKIEAQMHVTLISLQLQNDGSHLKKHTRATNPNCERPCYYDPATKECRCDSMPMSHFRPDNFSSPAD